MRERLRSVAGLAWWAVRLEVTLYGALLRWVTRRPAVPADAVPVGYAGLVAPMMGLWIFASALEVPLVHVLVPWEGLRLLLLAVSVWGLLWMVGMYAALRTYPHLLVEEGLRLRYATMVDLELPWSAVQAVRVDERTLPSSIRILQRVESAGETQLHVAVGARTNVTADLHGPTVVRTRHGDETVGSVSFWVDEPRAFVAAGRRRLGSEVHPPTSPSRRPPGPADRTD